MFVLHVDISVKSGEQAGLKKTYFEVFQPAISAQEGFSAVGLLHSTESGDEYRLAIAFDQQALQKKWVATDLHQQVWSQMEKHFAQYSVKFYNAI